MAPLNCGWSRLPFNKLGKLLCLLLVLGVAGYFVLVPHPALFHERPEAWALYSIPISPVTDHEGNFVYFDDSWNFVVVVLTNDPNCKEQSVKSTHYKAILFAGTPYEFCVDAQKDTLLIITANHLQGHFALPPATSLELRDHLQSIFIRSGQPHKSLILSILEAYDGVDKPKLQQFVDNLRGRQVAAAGWDAREHAKENVYRAVSVQLIQ
jgi:hypothetical protein